MKAKVIKDLIAKRGVWELGNKVLYDLCERHPWHKEPDVIVAKIWLIGRSYAAAIERRKNGTEEGNDEFYERTVVKALKKSKLDEKLGKLRKHKAVTRENLNEILGVHKYLVDVFSAITGLEKRSLASKYLHFHLPSLFYIYDSRADARLKKFFPHHKLDRVNGNIDNIYAKFCRKMLLFQTTIKEKTGLVLSPRELDDFLLNTEGQV